MTKFFPLDEGDTFCIFLVFLQADPPACSGCENSAERKRKKGNVPLEAIQLVGMHEQAHGAYFGARHAGVGLNPVRLARVGAPAQLCQPGHTRQEPEVVAALRMQCLAIVHLQAPQLCKPCTSSDAFHLFPSWCNMPRKASRLEAYLLLLSAAKYLAMTLMWCSSMQIVSQ